MGGTLEGARLVGGYGQYALADVALQVVLAVGEDPVLDAPSGFGRLQQIAVELFHIVGIDLPVDDEVSFELDIGVARVHIDALDAVCGWWDFGLDLLRVGDDACVQGEVAESVTDVVFGIAVVSAIQDIAEILDRRIVVVVELSGLCLG